MTATIIDSATATPATLLQHPGNISGFPPTAAWRTLFEVRQGRHRDVQCMGPLRLRPEVRAGLRTSLPVFQLGETGEGTHLVRAAAARGDADYARACQLFVREEQEHARLLGLVLDELRVARRTAHWSDGVFQTLRRLGGLRTEVLLLLVAELVALRYYSALRDGVGDLGLARLFGRIHADELRHVEFHVATLPRQLATLPEPVHLAVKWGWYALAGGTIVLVAVGHRQVLTACDVPPRRFARETLAILCSVGPRIFARR